MQFELLGRKTHLGAARVDDAGSGRALIIQRADLVDANDDLIDFTAVQLLLGAEHHRRCLAKLRLALHVVARKVALVEDVIVAGGKLHRQNRENEGRHEPVIRLEIRDAHVGQVVIRLPSLGDVRGDGAVGSDFAHVLLLLSVKISRLRQRRQQREQRYAAKKPCTVRQKRQLQARWHLPRCPRQP